MTRLLSIIIAALLGISGVAAAAPLRVLAIGDSMTEEYAYEFPFSAPESQPTNANTRSWPELLRIFRPTEASLGPLEATGGSYLDLRNAGHEWNFGIPGMTMIFWKNLLYNTPSDDKDEKVLKFGYGLTRDALEDEIGVAQVVVILLGANDLKKEYNDLFNNTEDPEFLTELVSTYLNHIHAWVRILRPNVPIIVCTVPDVGATPQISGTYNIPAKQASTRAKIAAFNQAVITWAAGKNPAPTIARLDRLTDRLFDEHPFQLNGTVFNITPHPENPPTSIFCRDGFHVATMAQALIANEIMVAINAKLGTNLTPFSNREILQNLLGLNPDQPYLTWVSGAGLPGSAMNADPDHDGLPNVLEFAMGTPPGSFSRPLTGSFAPGRSLSWRPDPLGLRFANLIPQESTNLTTWTPVPPARTQTAGDGTVSVTPAAGSKGFVRLQATPKP
ncbi:SGNH/GDSL hydrolase family protein [Luteolibacter arcticus]|uniref:SGNH/GDSL hydrolase family protein n=1 Tax=Luteolibacter arcticus TaxID=1581411 RepID=A0ABT3GME3_9BACT|nr:SGNH/GDSL hydrolase family protein [Luteolibacter arcticus]MCW1924698.1 SGNH/GDSL hydrolase family protein [Luteolibacter arcticus]